MVNRYYVGARHITEAISDGRDAKLTFATLEEAIAEAVARVKKGEVNVAIVSQAVVLVVVKMLV